MKLHASRPRFHNDPEPWAVTLATGYAMHGLRHWRGAADDWDDAIERAEAAFPKFQVHTAGEIPRPEYRLPQFNDTNPVLVEFRDNVSSGDRAVALDHFLDALRGGASAPDAVRATVRAASPDAAAHARRVLTRLSTTSSLTRTEQP